MMKVLGIEEVKLSLLTADPLPEPDDLVDAIEAAGLIHEPVVRKSDMKIVCGFKRIAAHVVLKRKTMPIKFVEGTDDEVRLWFLQENAHRKRMTDSERSSAIRETYEILRRMRDELPPPAEPETPVISEKTGLPKRGPKPNVAENEVRDETAKTLNVSRRTVDRSLAKPVSDRKPPSKPPFPFETFGTEMNPEFLDGVEQVCRRIESMQGHLLSAAADLRLLMNDIDADVVNYPREVAKHLHRLTQELSWRFGGAMPVALCWYCKGVGGLVEQCQGCGGSCVGIKDVQQHVPQELLSTAEVAVRMPDGSLEPFATAAGPTALERAQAGEGDLSDEEAQAAVDDYLNHGRAPSAEEAPWPPEEPSGEDLEDPWA